MNEKKDIRSERYKTIVILYPFALLAISMALNALVFKVQPSVIAMPTTEYFVALVVAAVLLIINHTWLMTTTELTRVRFKMFATPEEWAASGNSRQDAPTLGLDELERRHNAHRNITENAVYFVFLTLIFVFVSPTIVAAWIWIVGFAVARLGYTYGYLVGNTSIRGLFMSLSLLSLYGLGSYLVMGLLV